MAKYTRTFTQDFDKVLQRVVSAVMDGSASATLEEQWDSAGVYSRCAVRVFERYSYTGNNRVSMSVTLYQDEGRVHLCAITSG